MDRFPKGGWELDDYLTFDEWARELKLLDSSRTVNEAILALFQLNVRLETLLLPEELEDELSEDDPYEEEPAPPSSSKALLSIKVKPRAPTAPGGSGLLPNDPKVSLSCFSPSSAFYLTFSIS